MKIFSSIITFFKNLFIKEEQVKMIESENMKDLKTEKNRFRNELKVERRKKKSVETLVCYGDGLGIKKSGVF